MSDYFDAEVGKIIDALPDRKKRQLAANLVYGMWAALSWEPVELRAAVEAGQFGDTPLTRRFEAESRKLDVTPRHAASTGNKQVYLATKKPSRALTAAACVLDTDPRDAVVDVVYELFHFCNSADEARAAVLEALGRVG